MKQNLVCKNELKGMLFHACHSWLILFIQQIFFFRISCWVPGTELGTVDMTRHLADKGVIDNQQMGKLKETIRAFEKFQEGNNRKLYWGSNDLPQLCHKLQGNDISLRHLRTTHQIKLTISQCICLQKNKCLFQ